MRPRLDADRLEGLFWKTHEAGLPATLVAYIVLGCEWVFRIRKATEGDIQRELDAMEANLSKPLHQALTAFQAHLVIRSIEKALRKRLKGTRVLIPIGFFSPGWHSKWFGTRPQKNADRLAPRRSGPLPVLGPIIAGIMIDALLEGPEKKSARGLGRAFTATLLPRVVQTQEFKRWRELLDGLSPVGQNGPTPRLWLAAQVRRDHDRLFHREGLTPEDFLEGCGKNPGGIFGALIERDLLSSVYDAHWG